MIYLYFALFAVFGGFLRHVAGRWRQSWLIWFLPALLGCGMYAKAVLGGTNGSEGPVITALLLWLMALGALVWSAVLRLKQKTTHRDG